MVQQIDNILMPIGKQSSKQSFHYCQSHSDQFWTFKNTRKYRIVVLKYNQIDFKNATLWKELPNSQFQILQKQVKNAWKMSNSTFNR